MPPTPLRKSKSGRVFKPGQKDEVLRQHIQEISAQFPELSVSNIATIAKCSNALAHNILKKPKHDRVRLPREHSLGEADLLFISELCSSTPNSTLRSIRDSHSAAFGSTFHISSFSRLIKGRITKQVANRVDPRKLSPENCEYFLQYLHWQQSLSFEMSLKLCFFDEARIDLTSESTWYLFRNCFWRQLDRCTDTGQIHMYSQRGVRPTLLSQRRSFVQESYSLTVLTTMVDTLPLVFNIQKETGTSFTFVDFLADVLPYLSPNAIVIGDNCSFHCKGEQQFQRL